MEFTDRALKCVDCGAEFVFTAGEQLFFYDKQFKNDPKHCKQCKAKRARGIATGAARDAHDVLGLRCGNHRSLQADAGKACAVPLVLPEAAGESARCTGAERSGRLEHRWAKQKVAPELRREAGAAHRCRQLRPAHLPVYFSFSARCPMSRR